MLHFSFCVQDVQDRFDFLYIFIYSNFILYKSWTYLEQIFYLGQIEKRECFNIGSVNTRKRCKFWQYSFKSAKINGKRKQITKSEFKTKKEALEEGIKAKSKYDATGECFTPSEISFNDFIDVWIEKYLKVNCKPTTVYSTTSTVNKTIRKYFGNCKLKAIKPIDCDDFIKYLINEGYKVSSIKIIKGKLNEIFEFAIYPMGYIKDNPSKYIKLRSKNFDIAEKKDVISLDEYKEILNYFDKHRTYVKIVIQIAFYTGMRLGEILALTWNDVDFDNEIININKNYIELYECENNGFYISSTKTISSNRQIFIGDQLISILKNHKIKQNENKLKLGQNI